MNQDDFEALLPWRLTGKIAREDAARLEAALQADAGLRARMDLAMEDRAATVALNEALGAPSAAAWDRIAAVVAAEPRRRTPRERIAEFVGLGATPNRGRLAWAGAAAALVIVLQSAALLTLAPLEVARGPSGSYATASASRPVEAGTQYLVAFAPDARADAIGKFLVERKASVIDGPRAGMYRLRIAGAALDKAQAADLLREMRADPLVKAALPAGS